MWAKRAKSGLREFREQRHSSRNLLFIVAIVAAVVIPIIGLWSARPPNSIRIATGNTDSESYRYALEYKDGLAQRGYVLDIQPTAGVTETIQRLQDRNVMVGFVQGGVADAVDASGLESLATLYYESLWVFYRRDALPVPPRHLFELRGLRLAVGEVGTGGEILVMRLLQDNDVTAENSTLVRGTDAEKIRQLHDGDVDAAFFLLSANAPALVELAADPLLDIMSFEETELAYETRYPFLTTFVLGEGSLDLAKNLPAHDVTLLVTTVGLVAREDLHADWVRLLLEQAIEAHEQAGIFEETGEFPSVQYTEFPIRRSAVDFLRNGPIGIEKYLPFWLASRLERFIFLVLPLLLLLYPLIRTTPAVYNIVMHYRIYRWYRFLRRVELGMDRQDLEGIERSISQLERLQVELTNSLTVPVLFLGSFYNLRLHIQMVIHRLQERRAAMLQENQ